MSAIRRTTSGGIRCLANVTRVGIFDYRQADGSVHREFRPAEEVFHADSLASLNDATLTIGHVGIVTAANWRAMAVGHVYGGRRVDAFVEAYVVICGSDALKRIDRGEIHELSCGYSVDIDHTPGTWRGERYDAVQRNIRYNHVAMGPRNWGRAGREVALKL